MKLAPIDAIQSDTWLNDTKNLCPVSVTFGENGGIWEDCDKEGKEK